jgi:xylulokinase
MADAISSELRLEHNLFSWPYLPPDLWIAGGSTKTGAQSLQWLAEVLGGAEPVPVAALLAEASLVESGSSGVTFLPYLLGRGSPHRDADRTAAFVGMRLSTSRGALTRAVLEGAAFALRDIRDGLARVGYAPRPVRLSGGGGQSPLWRHILADVLEQPLTYFISDSTLGSAMVAAVGLGLHTDLSSAAAAMSKVSARHEPSSDSPSPYAEAYAAFQRARDAL